MNPISIEPESPRYIFAGGRLQRKKPKTAAAITKAMNEIGS